MEHLPSGQWVLVNKVILIKQIVVHSEYKPQFGREDNNIAILHVNCLFFLLLRLKMRIVQLLVRSHQSLTKWNFHNIIDPHY